MSELPQSSRTDTTILLRQLRRQNGLTLKVLADRAGLTESYLSKLERGHNVPSIAIALRLADALGVEVGTLFDEQTNGERVTIVRADSRLRLTDRSAGPDESVNESIAGGVPSKSMQPFVVQPAPRTANLAFREHAGEELVFVHAGTAVLQLTDQEFELEVGDAAYFRGEIPHRLVRGNRVKRASVLIVISRNDNATIPSHT